MTVERDCDVIIIGGGVSGTALLYVLAQFTDLERLVLLEKYGELAAVNSKGTNNSQTIHCGDIETNYSLHKAISVQRSANLLLAYSKQLPPEERDRVIFKFPKMVIGVGSRECTLLRQRFEQLKTHYPHLKLVEKEELAILEPRVALVGGELRPEELVALAATNEYSAVNYAELAQSFVRHACSVTGKAIAVKLNAPAREIQKTESGYRVVTPAETLHARFVVVCAGGHSLLLAHRLGYGRNFSCFPVAGSFYFTPQVLNGKVYTVQNDRLPFAAIHGDPDVLAPGKTRFGPTVLPLPLLERYNSRTLAEFLETLRLDLNVVRALWKLFEVGDIRRYIFKNLLFEIPWIRRYLFLQDARKIVPGLQLQDLTFAEGFGGIRPQLIDKEKRELILGEAKIAPGDGIIFNVTPSPGGTNCLGTAEKDAQAIADYLGCQFNREAFAARLLTE